MLGPAVRLTICVRWDCSCDTRERDGNGKKCELHYSAVKGVWQGSTLSSAAFSVIFWSKTQELLKRTNSIRPVMGFISYADDFALSSDDEEADRLWDDTGVRP